MKEHQYFVYILASISGTLYTGVCNDIRVRLRQHKQGKGSKFTAKYGCDRLVYYEGYRYIWNALEREKEIKGWRRSKKVALIESIDPSWRDLSKDWGKPVERLSPKK